MGGGVIGGGEMAASYLTVIAEGDLPSGEHWILRAGGTSAEFGTFLETIHPDGRRDEGGMGGPPLWPGPGCGPSRETTPRAARRAGGGMGGPPLWPGSIMNVYTGGTEAGPRRIVVRADPRVARVRGQLGGGEPLDLPPAAT